MQWLTQYEAVFKAVPYFPEINGRFTLAFTLSSTCLIVSTSPIVVAAESVLLQLPVSRTRMGFAPLSISSLTISLSNVHAAVARELPISPPCWFIRHLGLEATWPSLVDLPILCLQGRFRTFLHLVAEKHHGRKKPGHPEMAM